MHKQNIKTKQDKIPNKTFQEILLEIEGTNVQLEIAAEVWRKFFWTFVIAMLIGWTWIFGGEWYANDFWYIAKHGAILAISVFGFFSMYEAISSKLQEPALDKYLDKLENRRKEFEAQADKDRIRAEQARRVAALPDNTAGGAPTAARLPDDRKVAAAAGSGRGYE